MTEWNDTVLILPETSERAAKRWLCSAAEIGAVQWCSAVQCSAVQCSAVQWCRLVEWSRGQRCSIRWLVVPTGTRAANPAGAREILSMSPEHPAKCTKVSRARDSTLVLLPQQHSPLHTLVQTFLIGTVPSLSLKISCYNSTYMNCCHPRVITDN
jgi:hypothetical protein